MSASLESRHRNLERANAVRRERQNVKAWVATPPTRRAAWARAAEVIEDVWPEVSGMPVGALLTACSKTGPDAGRMLLLFAGINRSTELGRLRRQQRELLLFALRAGSLGAMRAATAQAIRSSVPSEAGALKAGRLPSMERRAG